MIKKLIKDIIKGEGGFNKGEGISPKSEGIPQKARKCFCSAITAAEKQRC